MRLTFDMKLSPALFAQRSKAEANIKRKLAAAARRAAHLAVKIAKDLVPVDTGELKSSITWSGQVTKFDIHAFASHAGYVEFGTIKTRAQPFLRPAVKKARAQLAREARAILKEKND